MSYESNYEPHERVLHKLIGAAYQMTFDRQYEMAVQASVMAVTYWRQYKDGEMDAEEAAVLFDDSGIIGRTDSSGQKSPATTDGGTATVQADDTTKEEFPCDVCGKVFESRDAVNGHQAAHVDKKQSVEVEEESGLDALFESDDPPTDNQGYNVPIRPGTQRHEIGKVLVYGPKQSYTSNEVAEKVKIGKSQSVQPQLSKMHQAGWVDAERSKTNEPFNYTPTYALKKRMQEIGEKGK